MTTTVTLKHPKTGAEVSDPVQIDDVIWAYGSARDGAGLRAVLDAGLLDSTRHASIPDYRYEAIKRSLRWEGKDPVDLEILKDWLAATVANRPAVAAKMLSEALKSMTSTVSAAREYRMWLAAGADLYMRVPGNDGYPKAGYGSKAKLAFVDCAPIVNLFHGGLLSQIEDVLYDTAPAHSFDCMLEKVATFVTPSGVRHECNLFEYMGYAHADRARFQGALAALDTDKPEVRRALAETATSLIVAHRLGRPDAKHANDTVSKLSSLIVFGADLSHLAENLEELSRKKKIDREYGIYPLLASVDQKQCDAYNGTNTSGIHYFHIEQAIARMAGVGDFADEGRSGIDINACDSTGQTALHRAVRYGSVQVIEHLLSGGADVNARTKEDHLLVDDYIRALRKADAPTLLPMVSAARARQAITDTLNRARAAHAKPSTP